MDHPVRFGLLFAAGVLLGLVLLPVVSEVPGVFLVVCALILMVWICASSREPRLPTVVPGRPPSSV